AAGGLGRALAPGAGPPHPCHHRHAWRLVLEPITCERDQDIDQVAERADVVERVVRDGEIELVLDGDRQLCEIERVSREILDERQLGRELLLRHAQVLRDEPPHARLYDASHTHLLRSRPGPVTKTDSLAHDGEFDSLTQRKFIRARRRGAPGIASRTAWHPHENRSGRATRIRGELSAGAHPW